MAKYKVKKAVIDGETNKKLKVNSHIERDEKDIAEFEKRWGTDYFELVVDKPKKEEPQEEVKEG